MGYANEGLRFNTIAEAAIEANIFVKIGATDSKVIPATAGDKILGIAEIAAAIATAIGITHQGQPKLKLGGSVTRGERLKSDGSGYGVPVASNFDEYGAVALNSGVSGDVISVLLEKGIHGV